MVYCAIFIIHNSNTHYDISVIALKLNYNSMNPILIYNRE